MVHGLGEFIEHFSGHEKSYRLIGGVATQFYLKERGVQARATTDLDLVICAEACTPEFVGKFREFIVAGGYQGNYQGKITGQFYRFDKPANRSYPKKLELCTRALGDADLSTELDRKWVPIPRGDAYESIAALILDDDYYDFAMAHSLVIEGIPIIDAIALIALKARAWLDLSERRRMFELGESDEHIDLDDVKKHRNDIVRIAMTLNVEQQYDAPGRILHDVESFAARALEAGPSPRDILGKRYSLSLGETASLIRAVFKLGG